MARKVRNGLTFALLGQKRGSDKMIQQLVIQNFQAHIYTTIDLDKGVNVITGASDAGKSSVLRALLWVIKNRPTGNSIHNWKDNNWTQVAIVTDKGIVIKDRDKGKTSYSLYKNDEDDNPEVFEAFKTDVPSQVQDLLDISDINIQTQHQPYFLLGDSPGEIAKKLNELVGLDIIDSLFKNVNSKITSTKNSIVTTTDLIKELTDQLEEFKNVDEVLEKIELLEERTKKANELEKKIVEADKVVYKMKEAQLDIDDSKEWLKVKGKYEKIKREIDAFEANSKKFIEVRSLLHDMQGNLSSRTLLRERITALQERRKKMFSEYKVCPTCGQSIDKKILERMLK